MTRASRCRSEGGDVDDPRGRFGKKRPVPFARVDATQDRQAETLNTEFLLVVFNLSQQIAIIRISILVPTKFEQ